MEDLKSETINKEVHKSVKKTASVHSDGYKGYSKLKEVIAKHEIVVEPDYRRGLWMFP